MKASEDTTRSANPDNGTADPSPSILYFRRKLLRNLLRYTLIFGAAAYLLSVYFAWKHNLHFIILIDTLAYGFIGFLYITGDTRFILKAWGLLLIFYLLGLFLLIDVGPMGAGFYWLFMFSSMAGVLLGTRPVFFSLLVNILTFLVLGLLFYFGKLNWLSIEYNPIILWLIIGINFLCINAVVSISISILLSKLNQVLKQEQTVSAQLKEQIEHRMRAEEESEHLADKLMQNQKMEALGTLAGGVAHDFNNILSAIMGYAELTLLDLDKNSEAYENIENIYAASERAKGVIQQILTFSRSADNADRKPCSISEIVEECSRLFGVGIPSNINFNTENTIEFDTVIADRTQLYQVIMNFLTNALHAIGSNRGEIRLVLETENIDKSHDLSPLLDPNTYAKLSVSDTGCGMDNDQLVRIFEPYFTTRETGKGSGMGLAIALGIIKSHKGEIVVSSKPDKGSVFSLFLPVEKKPQQAVEPERPARIKGTETLLLVDDEVHILNIAKKYMESLGYQVIIFSDPFEAVDYFSAHPQSPDILVTDKKMPGMDGLKLAEKVKKIRPDIPAILCSGFADSADTEHFETVLIKPVKTTVLAETVRKVLDKD